MTRKLVASLVLGALLFAPFATADAQQPKKVWQIGFLAAGSAQTAHSRIEAFRQGLRAFGYVEGKDIVIEYRNAAGKVERFHAMLSNWFVSRWTLLSPLARPIRGPPRKLRA